MFTDNNYCQWTFTDNDYCWSIQLEKDTKASETGRRKGERWWKTVKGETRLSPIFQQAGKATKSQNSWMKQYMAFSLIRTFAPGNESSTAETHTAHTHTFNGPGLPGWAGTRKVKPIWILLKQESVSGGGISWAICKSAPCSRQITTTAPHHSVFYRPDALPAAQPTASKHWRQFVSKSHDPEIG